MTVTEELQLKYWTEFTAYLHRHDSKLYSLPNPKSCYEIYFGGENAHLVAIINSRGKENRIELYLTGDDARRKYGLLREQCEHEAAKVLGKLEWPEDDCKRQKVFVKNEASLEDTTQWPQQFEWMRRNMEAMHRYFAEELKQLQ